MEKILISKILDATKGKLISGDLDCSLDRISTDSRRVQEGDLFVALKGERFDGHDYTQEAIQKGARAVLVSKADSYINDNIIVVQVRDTLQALQDFASYYRKLFDIPVVAITGSTGKTTTKDMIAALLQTKYNILKSSGNLNNQIGLPITLFGLSKIHQIAVVEMGMSGFNEIRRLAAIANPEIGVITNIGISHIEYLGSKENILKAKLELFEKFGTNSLAILNADDELLWNLRSNLSFPVIYFGTRCEQMLCATNIRNSHSMGISYTLLSEKKQYEVNLNIAGKHNVYNSMAAIAVARHFGVEFELILKALSEIKAHKMRLESSVIDDGITLIDDTYNASPDSVFSAINVLSDFQGKRRIAILGEMLELGEYSEYAHRSVGDAVLSNGIDVLVTKGCDSRFIAYQAIESGMDTSSVFCMNNNAEIIDFLKKHKKFGDVILVKGSRGMHMEDIVDYLKKGRQSECNI